MDRTAIWPLIDPVYYALSEAVDRQIAPAFIAEGFQGIQWWIAYQAWVFIDEPFTAQTLQLRMPFASPALLDDAILDLLADRLFHHIDEGVYRLSERGVQVVVTLLAVVDEAIACLEPMPEAELDTLAGIVHRTAAACLDAPTPSAHRVARTTYDRQWPGEGVHPLVQIRYALETMRAFHDEIECAVWGDYVTSAPEWDAFATIASVKGLTSAALQAHLSTQRAFPEKVYGDALKSLTRRGWLMVNGDGRTYILSREGRRTWKDFQLQIDTVLALPLEALSDETVLHLRKLLDQLKRALMP